MFKILFVVSCLISFHAFAATSQESSEMVSILKDNGVIPSQSSQDQEATIRCLIPKNSKKHHCTVFAGPSGYELNSNFEDLTGANARALSNLMVQFNVKPTGKRSIQYAQINCRNSIHNSDGASECVLVPHYFTPTN